MRLGKWLNSMKTKSECWDFYYAKTRPLERGASVTAEDFRKVFPTRESIVQFWDDTKKLRWPESYGQTPWEFSSWVASGVALGSERDGKALEICNAYLEATR